MDAGQQVHDFEPGIAANGLFWTIPVSPDAVAIDLDAGTARFHAQTMPMPDFFNFPNAVGLVPNPVPPGAGHVSFDVRWQASGAATQLRDAVNHFAGLFIPSQARIWWSASEPALSFQFMSDGADTSTTIQTAVIGHERNGVFF